jgi:hypothetical protein
MGRHIKVASMNQTVVSYLTPNLPWIMDLLLSRTMRSKFLFFMSLQVFVFCYKSPNKLIKLPIWAFSFLPYLLLVFLTHYAHLSLYPTPILSIIFVKSTLFPHPYIRIFKLQL